MKRLIFMVIVLLFSANMFSQNVKFYKGKDTLNMYVPYKHQESLASVQVVDAIFDNTTQAIEKIAKSLKVPAEYVYTILVRQQIVQGVATISVFVLSVVLLLLSMYGIKKWEQKRRDPEGFYVAMVILGIFVLAMMFVVTISSIPSLLNPEYYAIKEIMEVL